MLTLLIVFGLLTITFAVLAMLHKMPAFAPWLALAPAAPWVVIGPWVAQWVRERTIRALDALLGNMTMLEPRSAVALTATS